MQSRPWQNNWLPGEYDRLSFLHILYCPHQRVVLVFNCSRLFLTTGLSSPFFLLQVLSYLTWFLSPTQGGGGGSSDPQACRGPLPQPGPALAWHLAGFLLHNLFDVLFWFPPPPQSVGEPLPYILLPWPGVSHGLGEAALLFSPRTTALVGERGWVLLVV